MKRSYILMIVIPAVLFLLALILINIGTLDGWWKDFDNEFYKRNWLGFWGSVIGGMLTIIGVIISTTCLQKNLVKQAELDIRPYFFATPTIIADGPTGMYNSEGVWDEQKKVLSLYIRNDGNGTGIFESIKFVCLSKKLFLELEQERNFNYYNYALPQNESYEYSGRLNNSDYEKIKEEELTFVVTYRSVRSKRYAYFVIFKLDNNKFNIISRSDRELGKRELRKANDLKC